MGESTTFSIEPLDASFGAIVRDIDLRNLDEPTWNSLYAEWLEYGLLIFPGQFLSKPEQNDFARRFGALEFEAAAISNVDKNGNVHSVDDDDVVKSLRGNQGWHHDSTYMPVQAKGAVFTAEVVPEGGAPTGWADMRAAYDDLDDEKRRQLEQLTARHSLYYSQGRSGYLPSQNESGGYDLYGYHELDVSVHPLIKVHPETGRPNLLIGRHAHDISGMSVEESEKFIDELNDWACQEPRIHHHRWEEGDAVVWDNRRLMHRGTPWDMKLARVMWHTRIAGDPATETALNHQGKQADVGTSPMMLLDGPAD